MEEWFHVKHDRMVELQEIAFRVRCLSLEVDSASPRMTSFRK